MSVRGLRRSEVSGRLLWENGAWSCTGDDGPFQVSVAGRSFRARHELGEQLAWSGLQHRELLGAWQGGAGSRWE